MPIFEKASVCGRRWTTRKLERRRKDNAETAEEARRVWDEGENERIQQHRNKDGGISFDRWNPPLHKAREERFLASLGITTGRWRLLKNYFRPPMRVLSRRRRRT
jgi:hypothetical protein